MTLLATRDAIVHRMSYSRSTSPILLAVRDLREEVRAGFGQSLFAVRPLDGVSLAVRGGELVVLRGGVACGAASLIAHLTGIRAIRSGARIVARGVQVRRGCISERALAALMSGWSAIPEKPVHVPVRRALEPPAQPDAIHDAAMHAKARDATRTVVHHHEHPVCPHDRRFASNKSRLQRLSLA